MHRSIQHLLTVSTLALSTCFNTSVYAQNSTPSSAPVSAPDRYLKVSAPYAQKLLVEAKAAHPELKKIGLHVVPPGETESCIIANPITSKIGKVSSPRDLTVVTSGTAKVYPHAEEGGFFDLGLPMFDAQKRPLGLMVMEIPYKFASTNDDALKMGLKIRDEIAARIPNKQALFQPASEVQAQAADPQAYATI
jgi:hypothetical protein